ncbi:gypsy retrotransposon integrase-like protein 1 isoform 4-T4 [Polymixia lowei]
MERKRAAINPRSRRYKPITSEASQRGSANGSSATAAKLTMTHKSSYTHEPAAGDPTKVSKWTILMDEALVTIESFPHFFHGDYCKPQDIQWAPDDIHNVACEDPENIIEVKEPWQWLGLDVRGPLPLTQNGHKYILTVTDFHSKWVEALPMQSCLSSQVTKHIVDIISHFGYPFRILSRLPHEIVKKINRELKEQLKIKVSLVVYHQQTGTADLITQQLIDRMVSDLMQEHAADWDIYLPAKVFSLCLNEHSKTKERPFSVLCCKGLEPVQTPRGLNYAYSKIRGSVFVVE